MHVQSAIRLFLDHRRRKRRSSATIALYTTQLDAWVRWRTAWGSGPRLTDVTLSELRAFFAYLAEEASAQRGIRRNLQGLSPATVRSYFRTMRALWRFLEYEEDECGEGVLRAAQLRYFRNDRIPLPSISKREQPSLSRDAFEALLHAAGDGDDEQSARDRAILLLLWESGMRIHELARLDQADVDLKERHARIVGKGDKEGVVFWGRRAGYALAAYLRQRRGPWIGPVIRGVSSRNNGDRVTPNLIRCLIKRLARKARVRLPQGSPCHCFRRAFARHLRKQGLSKAEVGELLRDSTPEVIDRYIGLDVEPLRRLHRRAFAERDRGVPMGQTM